MFTEMNSLVDEVRQIEGKVLEISRLQEIFTENVLSQVKALYQKLLITLTNYDNMIVEGL